MDVDKKQDESKRAENTQEKKKPKSAGNIRDEKYERKIKRHRERIWWPKVHLRRMIGGHLPEENQQT